ncbi:aquaporin [marine bacterium AO1-C]|nr:aquaporin [marine bacterium AO1-C]
MSVFIAELIGTAMLLLLGNGVVANVVLKKSKGENSGWIVITLGWAIAVFVAVFIVAPVSGAHLNPAVTIGLLAAGKITASLLPTYLGAQFLGAALGSTLVWLHYRPHFNETDDPEMQLAVFSTGPAIRDTVSNLISEIIGTFVLVYAVFYITSPKFGNQAGSLGSLDALPVALVVLGIGLSLGGTTGYAINPARDLGPRIMHAILPIKGKGSSDWGYAWIPIVGPIIGGVLAALLFKAF